MKKLLFSALGLVIGFGSVIADDKPNPPKPATEPQKDVTVPVILKRERHTPIKHTPSIGLSITATVTDMGLVFNFPLSSETYPLTVELELLTEPYGYWTASFANSSLCELEFDGTTGDYHISVITSEAVEYSGYFTLE